MAARKPKKRTGVRGSKVRPELVATVLVESNYVGNDIIVGEKYGVHPRSIKRYRAQATFDPHLARLVIQRQQSINNRWSDKIGQTIEMGLETFQKALERINETKSAQLNPDLLQVVVNGITVFGQMSMTCQAMSIKAAETVEDEKLPTYVPDRQIAAPPDFTEGELVTAEGEQ